MNTTFLRFAAVALVALLGVSCTTTYDTQGRAVQSVSPEGAVLGAAAAGLIGYTLAKNRHKKDDHRRYYNRHDNHYHGYRGYDGRRQSKNIRCDR